MDVMPDEEGFAILSSNYNLQVFLDESFFMVAQYLDKLPNLNKWLFLQHSHFPLMEKNSYKFKLQEGLKID
jgi:hypothetical protein